MNILPFFVAIPMLAAFLIPVLGRRRKMLPDIMGNVTALAILLLALRTIGMTGAYAVGGWAPSLGITLVADGLATMMLLIVALVSFVLTLYSVNYMELYTSKARYYGLFLLLIAGLNGVIISGDLFNLFIFLELASIASYALVAFGCQQEELEASFKYLILGSLATCFILLGIAFLYGTFGTLNLAYLGQLIAAKGSSVTVRCALGLFVVGFGLKAALVPFHAWLPDAHPAAPAPISAMLSGVLIKTLGIYALMRLIFNVFGFTPLISHILVTLGIISMAVGAFLAIGQWDYKRLLAYSSISQIGYITLAIGLGTPLGILAGLFHLINHSVFKPLLFLNAGSVDYALGTRDMREMGGLKEKMPVTSNTSLIGAFSISGMPPFSGFWSKFLIVLACVQANNIPAAIWAVLVSIITLSYFMKIQRHVYYGNLRDKLKDVVEVPRMMRAAMILLAIGCVLMGLLILPGPRAALLTPAADALLAGREGYFNLVSSIFR